MINTFILPMARWRTPGGIMMHIPRLYGKDVFIELHLRSRAALKEVVGLRQPLVIVQGGVLGDLGNMHGRRKLGRIGKSPARCSTGTRHSRYVGEIDYTVALPGRLLVHRRYPALASYQYNFSAN